MPELLSTHGQLQGQGQGKAGNVACLRERRPQSQRISMHRKDGERGQCSSGVEPREPGLERQEEAHGP